MKYHNITKGIVAFSVVALLSGGLVAVNAATNETSSPVVNTRNKMHNKNFTALTTSQKTAIEAKRAANQAAMTAKQVAIKSAITNNDYQAWVKAVGTSNPIVQKINATNFSQYVQAYNLRLQADQIMTNLGLGKGEGLGLGLGKGEGNGVAWGRMMNNGR
ncbi:MAG: hypothetical protein WC249_01245 [Patescibacteria group bacterium]|jgi:hypothetical protein